MFESYLHYGPMARSVADGALMQNVMSGQHPHDLATLRERVVVPQQPGSIKGWKIALSMDLGYKRIDPEVERATRHAAQVFRDLGCTIEDVDLGWTSATVSAWEVRSKTLVAHSLGPYLLRWRHELHPDSVRDVEQGRAFTIDDLLAGRPIRAEMWMKLSPILSRYHLLLCPTLALPSVAADHSIFESEVLIDGERVEPYVGWCLTYPFNTLGQLPVAGVAGALGASTPDFVLGVALVYVFSVWSLGLTVGGFVPFFEDPLANLRAMVLPASTLSVFGIALILRTTRESVLTVMTEGYITSAVARGDRPRSIVRRHVLRNASLPVLTVATVYLSLLLGGAVIVEILFTVPGVGLYTWNALLNRDYGVTQSAVLLFSGVIVTCNMLVDIAYALLDPRIRGRQSR